MGVSADTGNIDLNLVVGGGDGFVSRLTELRSATDNYNKALSDLNLGKSAVAANDEAGRVLSAAKAKSVADLAALDDELAKARNSLNAWVEQTKVTTMAAYDAANQTLADAKSQQDAANTANMTAQAAVKDAKAQADTIIKDARAEADRIIADGNATAAIIVAEARRTQQEANDALAMAEASRQRYDKAVARMKEAMLVDG